MAKQKEPDIVAVNIRFPRGLWWRIRALAVEQRSSASATVVRTMEKAVHNHKEK